MEVSDRSRIARAAVNGEVSLEAALLSLGKGTLPQTADSGLEMLNIQVQTAQTCLNGSSPRVIREMILDHFYRQPVQL